MLKHFSTFVAYIFILSVVSGIAQTYTYNTGTTWQNITANGTWIQAGGATGYPGLTANNGAVTLSPSAAFTFIDAPPVFSITSLTMSGSQPVTLGAGTLTINGAFTINAGATLNIPAGTTVIANGAATIGGTINLQTATSKIIFNSTVTQTGAGVITAAATVQLGASVTSLPGVLFQNPFGGKIQTGAALNLTSNLTIGAAGTVSLFGTMTLNAGVTLTVNNVAAQTTVFPGAGALQGVDATSVVNFASGPTALQGTRFANPFSGTLRTSTAGASTLASALTIDVSGVLNLGQQLNPSAGVSIILNNTAANSLTGVATGKINIINTVIVSLGPGFNNNTLDGDRFLNPITGTLNTASSLTATGTATPILQFNNANGVFNISGTLTIASGKTIFMNNTAAGSLPGSGIFAATDNTSILRFVNAANGGNVSGNIFSNPWNGRLRNDGVLQIGTTLGTAGSSVLNAGPNAIFDLGGVLTVNDSLALNCTQSLALAFQGGASFITALAGGPSTGAPGPGGRVSIGANTFLGSVPVARLGNGTNWLAGNLFIFGSTILNANYTFNNGAFLFLNTGSVLTVATTRTLTLNGNILGAGLINGQDNTAVVTLGAATFTFGNPPSANIPGATFGTPNFDGRLNISQARTLTGSLRMGVNSIYGNLAFTTTVNTPDTLYLNQTAAAGLSGAGTFVGTGTLNFGNAALNNTFPTASVPSGLAPANFGGRIILGDAVNFAANYNVLNSTILQLNGTSLVNAGVTLTLTNTAANMLNGTGRLQAQAATSVVTFAAGANAGVVPGANIATAYLGQLTTAGAMNLTGNLSMGATSVLNLGGNLTLSQTSQVTLGMTALPATSLLGAGLLVGQPTVAGVPEIILPNGSLGGQLPGITKISTGVGAAFFGGRITVGTGYAVSTNIAINQPAILNIQTGAQLLVNFGRTLSLNTTNSPATGTGTGTIQGQDNTAIVSLGNGFNGGVVPGTLFANPFAGQLVIPSGGLTQTGNITMGTSSILQMNGNLTVNSGTTLTLNGGSNSLLSGGGLLNGTNTQSIIALGAGFNGGTIPANRLAAPFNGALTTAGAMTLSGALTFGASSSLALGGDLTIPAATNVYLGMTGANTLTSVGRFIAAAATSQASLAPGFNGSLLPSASFTNFGGIVAMNSALSLSGSLVLGAPSGVLDLGGNLNTLTLGTGGASLSVANPIRGTTSTAFIVTNGTGGLTINNSALTSYFFPVGTTPTTYTPLSLSNASTADIFTVRARPGITNIPATYPNFVNVEWLISQAGSGNRNLTLSPQWAATNQQGTSFNTNAVGLALFSNNQYVETSTGASIGVFGGYSTFSGTFNGAFSSTPLVAFSKVVLIAPVPTIVNSLMPSSLPVSNEGFTVTLTGSNLAGIRTVTAQNLTSNVSATGIITAQFGTLLTVSFPGTVRGISGTMRINLLNAGSTTSVTTAQITITPIAKPTLSTFAPSTTIATGRAFTLNLTGTGFLSQAQFTVNSIPSRAMGITTETSAALEIPAALNNTSGTLRVRLTNSDGQFAESPYTVTQAGRPSITSISPRAVFVGTNGVTINVEGAGFFGNGFVTARFVSTPIDVNVVSSTRLTLTVPASLLTSTGFPTIIISNSDGESIGYVFSILERAPQGATPIITSYSPVVTTASQRAFSVAVKGSNFNPRAIITVRGVLATPSVLDTNRFVVEIPPALNSNTAPNTVLPLDIVLQNPDIQITAATVSVGTALPAPILNSISPSGTSASTSITGRPFTIIISGANFTPDAVILFNGQVLQTIDQTSTVIRAIVPTNSVRQPPLSLDGINSIIVLNGDGQATPVAAYFISIVGAVLDNSLSGFSIYPSPVSDMLTIQGGFERPTNVVVTISNVLGQRLMNFNEQRVSGSYNRSVNVAALPCGAYIVEVTDGSRRMVQKVIKY